MGKDICDNGKPKYEYKGSQGGVYGAAKHKIGAEKPVLKEKHDCTHHEKQGVFLRINVPEGKKYIPQKARQSADYRHNVEL